MQTIPNACRKCSIRPAEAGSVICTECLRPVRAKANAKNGAISGLLVLVGFVGGSVYLLSTCSLDETSPYYPRNFDDVLPQEQRAYDALRQRGFSDADARAAAGGVRQICLEMGGTDCD